MYIEEIINRLNDSTLQDTDNEGRIVLDGTLGEYLENYNNHFKDLFLKTATGKYLDLHGQSYGVIRSVNESDDDYRNRIFLKISSTDSSLSFIDNNIRLWVMQPFFLEEYTGSDDEWTLTSRKTCLRDEYFQEHTGQFEYFYMYYGYCLDETIAQRFKSTHIGFEIYWLDEL